MKSQHPSLVLHVIRGHGLLSFLESSSSTDSSTTSASTGGTGSTSQSDQWQRQDQLILAWLLSSLGKEILPQAISCETSADLWRMLHSTYSAQSTSRVLELKLQLQTLKKGNLTCTGFSIASNLSLFNCAQSAVKSVIKICPSTFLPVFRLSTIRLSLLLPRRAPPSPLPIYTVTSSILNLALPLKH
jgi:hypothetical protein